jgi:hypothetical protein
MSNKIEFTELCRPIPNGDCELHHYGIANGYEFALIECINKYIQETQYEIMWAYEDPRDLNLEQCIVYEYVKIKDNES